MRVLTMYCQNNACVHARLYAFACMGRKPKARRSRYGAWLHFLRQANDMTQQQVAKKAGIPRTTLMHLERTGKLTGRNQILKLAGIYRVSVQKLLRAEKLPKQK